MRICKPHLGNSFPIRTFFPNLVTLLKRTILHPERLIEIRRKEEKDGNLGFSV